MTSQRQREANRRNGAKSAGPVSASGKRISSQNARKHGLSSAEVGPVDDALKIILMADAKSRGFDEVAAEALASSILQHQRVCRAYADIYERDISEQGTPNLETKGQVRRLRVNDLLTAYEALIDDSPYMTAKQQQTLIALTSGYQVGDVVSDTTIKTLLGLERHLQRSAARIVKAARMG